MTICIAAHGHNAGRAVLNALSAVEAVASGAIGGFVGAVALLEDQCLRAETQNGGTDQLVFEQSKMLFEQAKTAGLISSGPNRPAPLSDFLPAVPGVGLVTGHRSPSSFGGTGEPLNVLVMKSLQAGMTSLAAVQTVVSANPCADAGFIAMTCNGDGYAGNTQEVLKRPDVGSVSVHRQGASVYVMHNAITPVYPMADLAAQIALETLCPLNTQVNTVLIEQGCEVIEGASNVINVNEHNRVVQLVVAQSLSDGQVVLNLGFQPSVYCKNEQIGVLLNEPYLLVNDGRLSSANGLSSIEMSVGRF